MIELVLAAIGLKSLQAGGVWVYLKHRKQKRILDNTDQEPLHIPIIDGQLERMAGTANMLEGFATKQIVSTSRKAVNTKAFEHVVAMFVNQESSIRNDDIRVFNASVDIKL